MTVGQDLITALEPLVRRVRTDVTAIKRNGAVSWTREPLTPERLAKHLNGGPARGVSPIKAGESVTMVALLDLDSHKGEAPWERMVEAAERITAELLMRGLVPNPWRSSGGRGIHLIMLWDEPQDAYSVRMELAEAIAECGFRNGDGGVAAGQVEIFPKQDAVAADGFGNQFILPLAGASEPLVPVLGWDPGGRDLAVTIGWETSSPVPVRERPRPVLGAPMSVEQGQLHRALQVIPNDAEQGPDREGWFKILCAFKEGGGDREVAREWSKQHPSWKTDREFDGPWESIKVGKEGGVPVDHLIRIAEEHGFDELKALEFPIEAVSQDVEPLRLSRDKAGRILATVENVAVALRNPVFSGMEIRFDRFRDEIMWSDQPDQWRPFTDQDYVRLRIMLEQRGFKPIGRELVRDVVLLVATESPFDSAQTWIKALAWDGTPRVEQFLARCFSVEDTAYTRAVSRYLWTALAGRVMEPGVKADMVPILVGNQGAGKSRAVAALSPAHEFFCEVSFHEKDEDLARKMRGRLVAEIGELRGLHTKELEAIKAFITRTHENWIPKYREFAVQFPRRLVFIGTTNKDEFLADETGNRRWLPVRVGQVDVGRINAEREQLWAEARELFLANGVEFQAAEALSGAVHAEHTITDSWGEAIERWLDDLDPITLEAPRGRKYLRVGDVLRGALKFDERHVGRREELRAGAILRTIGYERKKVREDGRVFWAFVPQVPA